MLWRLLIKKSIRKSGGIVKNSNVSDWRVTPGRLRDFRMSKRRPRHLFLLKVVPGKSQKDTLKDVTFHFQNSKQRSSFLQIGFCRVKKCRWSEEELFLGSWGKQEQEEKSHLRVSNDPTAERTNLRSRVKRRRKVIWYLRKEKRAAERGRMEETRTSNCIYSQSQDGWRKEEGLKWFLNQVETCVCSVGVDPSSAGTNMLSSAGSCSNSLNMASSTASGAPAAPN